MNIPSIKPAPINIKPQMFIKSTTLRIPGFEAIDSNIAEKIPLESIKYPKEDQFGSSIFTRPSYKKCHPIKTLSVTRKTVYMSLS